MHSERKTDNIGNSQIDANWNDSVRRHCVLVVDALIKGRVVPFLGAGVNLCDRPPSLTWKFHEKVKGDNKEEQYLPSARELAHHLAIEFHYPTAKKCSAKDCTCSVPEIDLSKVSQYGVTVLDTGPLYNELRSVFGGQFVPTSVHRFLANPPRTVSDRPEDRNSLIVSTNYDDLMEQALGEGRFDLVFYDPDGEPRPRFWHKAPGREPKRIGSPNDYPYISFQDRPVILKIHGTIDRANQDRAGFVITEDHYIEYLAQEPLEKLLPPSLIRKMRERHLLFLGYSLRDWNLRVFLRRLKRNSKQKCRAWAVLLDTDEAETKFWQKNDVDIINLDLRSYIDQLLHEIESRATSGAAAGSGK